MTTGDLEHGVTSPVGRWEGGDFQGGEYQGKLTISQVYVVEPTN